MRKDFKKQIQNYIQTYSDVSTWPVPDYSFWSNLVVIPCRNEFEDLLSSFNSYFEIDSDRYLIVLILNAPVDAKTFEFETNLKLKNFLKKEATYLDLSERFSLYKFDRFDIFLADFGTNSQLAFPEKQGVGYARKLGSDFAVRLYLDEKLLTPWISSTDADTRLPSNYFFDETDTDTTYHYTYEHQVAGDSRLQSAIEIYESYLRYHRLGLKHAASPYAYPSIGSCLRFSVHPYVQTRGFSKLLAGEDFYLLNKLSKTSPLCWGSSDNLSIKARTEIRTPFGTSASLKKIAQSPDAYKIYNPEVYEKLAELLQLLRSYSETLDLAVLETHLKKRGLHESFSECVSLSKLQIFLSQFKAPEQRHIRLHEHFDAWKTLKWIHVFSQQNSPKLAWRQALEKAQFLRLPLNLSSSSILKILREQDHKTSLASPWSLSKKSDTDIS